MARIHKVEMYLVDIHEDFETLNDAIIYMTNRKYSPLLHLVTSESKEFEWDDDIIINSCHCTNEQYNQFFEHLEG
jgi:hypothetical protein